jgi:ferredoxin--NADP+ reductase
MRHVAVIGSGPAGFYTAEATLKAFGDGVCVDLIDRLPVPYGLIRFGVAPDHQSIKAVSRRYEQVALSPHVRFVGNVRVGGDIRFPSCSRSTMQWSSRPERPTTGRSTFPAATSRG